MGDFGLRSRGNSVSGLADPSDSRPLSMRCLAHRQLGATWNNFPQSQPPVKPTWLCRPECIADVVAIVQAAERNRLHIHAFGSSWSFSDCAFDKTPNSPTCLIDTTMLTGIRPLPPGVMKNPLTPNLWYVECGASIQDLYTTLDASSQALQTMGGASGQTIAGAVSTGTHGADYKIPPIADSVLAIHLVGGAGVQFWIEPTGGITNPAALHAGLANGVDPGNIIYDDDIFNSCLVSIGVMGVIYAFVLQARDQYPLVEYTEPKTWQWVDTNFPTLLDPKGRFLQLAVSPYPDPDGTNTCLVTTRVEVPSAAGACTKADPGPVMDELTSRLEHAAAGKDPGATVLTGGLSLAVVYANLAKIASIGTSDQDLVDTINALIPDYRSTLESEYVNLMKTILPPFRTCSGKSYEVMDSNRRLKNGTNGSPDKPPSPALSFEVFFPADVDNGNKASWVSYVSEALRTIQNAENTFLVGYVSVRFMGKTRALLGMAQWNPTCSVEISVLGGVNNLPGLLATLLSNSKKYGALQHWGQLLDKGVDANAYPNVGRWRAAYAEMNRRSNLSWFQTDLSRRSGLTLRS
jgi:hypothetical protein